MNNRLIAIVAVLLAAVAPQAAAAWQDESRKVFQRLQPSDRSLGGRLFRRNDDAVLPDGGNDVITDSPSPPQYKIQVGRLPFLYSARLSRHHKRSEPSRIVILGGPASGKGTQCKRIATELGLVHLSTGDMLREEIEKNSQEGQMAKSYMKNGQLVPDEIVTRIISKRIQDSDCQQMGYILDGFPRTQAQAEYLNKLSVQIDITLVLDVPDEELIARVVGRRVDPVTGEIYHLKFRPPPSEIADRLTHRSDDKIETVAPRLSLYQQNLQKILAELGGSVVRIDGAGSSDVVASKIKRALSRRKKHVHSNAV